MAYDEKTTDRVRRILAARRAPEETGTFFFFASYLRLISAARSKKMNVPFLLPSYDLRPEWTP
jgi:hypothetical protein